MYYMCYLRFTYTYSSIYVDAELRRNDEELKTHRTCILSSVAQNSLAVDYKRYRTYDIRQHMCVV
jgi:hypothetical protein